MSQHKDRNDVVVDYTLHTGDTVATLTAHVTIYSDGGVTRLAKPYGLSYGMFNEMLGVPCSPTPESLAAFTAHAKEKLATQIQAELVKLSRLEGLRGARY